MSPTTFWNYTRILRVLVLVLAFLPRSVARAQATGSAPPSDLLRVGDLLRIRVWPDSVLGGQFTIEETGLIYLPVIGEYRAAGRSVASVRQDLRQLYGKEVKSPVVTVSPAFRVSVLGAVQRPGLYFADPTQTWYDLISEAGGFTDRAVRDHVRILRDARWIDLNALPTSLTDLNSLNVAVQSGDRIVVSEKSAVNWLAMLSVLQTVAIIATAIRTFR
jgi:polysaccharide export outer membrane protein